MTDTARTARSAAAPEPKTIEKVSIVDLEGLARGDLPRR